MAPFVHRRRPAYADVDMQGVVFHGHWLAYFDDAMTRFVDWLGFPPQPTFAGVFDVMVVKATLDWSGPAAFDDEVEIAVEPIRLGTASFDLRYTASVADRTVCIGVVTYVSIKPGTPESVPIPDDLRAKLEASLVEEIEEEAKTQ